MKTRLLTVLGALAALTLGGAVVAQTIAVPTVSSLSSTDVVPVVPAAQPSAAGKFATMATVQSFMFLTAGTQCTASGATPQTCNGQRGVVTTNSLSTAAATDASYVINNSSVTASSQVQCTDQGYSGTLVTNGYPVIMTCVPGSGTITVHITNTHAANALSGTVKVGFSVLN